jgi:hypothetical protein
MVREDEDDHEDHVPAVTFAASPRFTSDSAATEQAVELGRKRSKDSKRSKKQVSQKGFLHFRHSSSTARCRCSRLVPAKRRLLNFVVHA